MAREITPETCAASPGKGRWSPGEILDHLILSENLHRKSFAELIELDRAGKRPVIYRTLSEFDTGPVGIPRQVMPLLGVPLTVFNLFVPNSFREFFIRNRIIPAFNPASSTPSHKPLAGLISGLEESFRQTEALFAANPNANWRCMRVCHPVLGNNSVTDLLRVLTFHEQRHQQQFRETVSDLRAQGTTTADLAPSSTK